MFKKIISSKILFFLLILILFLSLVPLNRELNRHFRLKKESNVLENYVNNLKNQNIKLTGQLADLKSNIFQEKQARGKLGLKKPGEKVVIINQEDLPSTTFGYKSGAGFIHSLPTSSEEKDNFLNKKTTSVGRWSFISNLKKWWNYFINSVH